MNKYHYNLNGRKQGPVSKTELLTLRSTGVLTDDSLVWCKGMPDWAPLATVLAAESAIPAPDGPKPSNGLVLAIISTIFGCLPMGIISIIKSAKVDSMWRRGMYAEARAAAKLSKVLSVVSIIIGIILNILSFVWMDSFLQQYGLQ